MQLPTQKAFARQTKLPNISGRADYISNPNRQDDIVLQSTEHMQNTWQDYANFEKQNKKSKDENIEGREIIIHLPKDLDIYPEELKEIMDKYCLETLGTNRDFQYAVHWNKDKTNLHAHIIFSERERCLATELKTYSRDMWYDKTTNRMAKANADNAEIRFKKGEYMRDKETGQIKHTTTPFTIKDRKFKSFEFNEELKLKQVEILNEYGYSFRMHDKETEVAQKHIGNKHLHQPTHFSDRDELTGEYQQAVENPYHENAKNRIEYNKNAKIMNEFLKENKMTVKDYMNEFKEFFAHNKIGKLIDSLTSKIKDLENQESEVTRDIREAQNKMQPYERDKANLKSFKNQEKNLVNMKIGMFDFKAQTKQRESLSTARENINKTQKSMDLAKPEYDKARPEVQKLTKLRESIRTQLNNARERLKGLVSQQNRPRPVKKVKPEPFSIDELIKYQKKADEKKSREKKRDRTKRRGVL